MACVINTANIYPACTCTKRGEAIGSVRPSVSLSVIKILATTKGLNTSKRHSNNNNSENLVHGVSEGS